MKVTKLKEPAGSWKSLSAKSLLGRVVNPLGQPVDGMGPVLTSKTRPIESPAPGVMDRKSVHEPLQTGIKSIDALIPIGRGQREPDYR